MGSEGLDQQHCHRIVNYDLPWNPMRIEQRIGRIDRFGQKASSIKILNLAVEGTIDAAILHRLYRRIRLFEDSLGMLDPLLGRAMRLIAHEELEKPMERTMPGNFVLISSLDDAINDPILIQGIPARPNGSLRDPSKGVETLISQREDWHKERSLEEREWIGPDPGIDQVRDATILHGLGVEPSDLREWLAQKMSELGGGLYEATEKEEWLLEFTPELLESLIVRLDEKSCIDRLQAGWKEILARAASSPGPHLLTVTFDRDRARKKPQRIYLTPWHPIVRCLCEQSFSENESRHFTHSLPKEWCDSAKWLLCVDWEIDGLQTHSVRRWLVINQEGLPIEPQPSQPWNILEQLNEIPAEENDMELINKCLDYLHGWLMQDAQKYLLPVVSELRYNAQSSWNMRISRERRQINEAQARAIQNGGELDERWIAMKRGLIRRLDSELDSRMDELDRVQQNLTCQLIPRIVVRLK